MPFRRATAQRHAPLRGTRERLLARLGAHALLAAVVAAAACSHPNDRLRRRDPARARRAYAIRADAGPAAPAPLPRRVALHPALAYDEITCALGVDPFRLHLLRLASGEGVEMRALANPTAHRDPRCASRSGGTDLVALLAAAPPGFHVLGATNGNFFHEVPDGTFRANGMIASATPEGLRLLAPVQPTTDPDYRGDRVLVLDATGGHEVAISTGVCTPGGCRVAVVAPHPAPLARALARREQPMTDGEFVAALAEAYPTATLAMQLTRAYAAHASVPADSVRCVPAHAWTCQPRPATLLCVAPGAAVTLITAEPARYEPLVRSLAPGGSCGLACSELYLLDGGGSAQIGYTDPADGRFVMRYSARRDPAPPAGCATYRPVAHYLIAGQPSPAAQASN